MNHVASALERVDTVSNMPHLAKQAKEDAIFQEERAAMRIEEDEKEEANDDHTDTVNSNNYLPKMPSSFRKEGFATQSPRFEIGEEELEAQP